MVTKEILLFIFMLIKLGNCETTMSSNISASVTKSWNTSTIKATESNAFVESKINNENETQNRINYSDIVGTGKFENCSSPVTVRPSTSDWTVIFDRVTAGATGVGSIANTFSFVILHRVTEGFAPGILFLLRVQSFLDGTACLFSTLLLSVEPFWTTKIPVLDQTVCHLWHGQGLYWSFVGMSVWNLVLIAVDRYIAVCRPLQFISMRQKDWFGPLVAVVGWGVYTILGGAGQVRFENGQCVGKLAFSGEIFPKLMTFFAISAFLFVFAVPALTLVIIYSKIIYTMRSRGQNKNMPVSSRVDKAAKEILRMAIVITVIFIITLGYDLTYYILAYTGVLQYIIGSPAQKLGVLLAALNNCVNPILYLTMMPNYRRNAKRALLCCKRSPARPYETSSNSVK